MDKNAIDGTKAEWAVEIIEKALSGKADAFEIFLSTSSGRVAEVKDGEVDSFKVSSSLGVGLRTLFEGRAGFGYSSVLSSDALKDMVVKTMLGSIVLPSDPFLSFPGPARAGSKKAKEVDTSLLYDQSFGERSGDELVSISNHIEESAREADPRVSNIRKSSYSERSSSTRLINSYGLDNFHKATFFSGSISVVAEADGESQMAWEVSMGHKGSDVDPALVGKSATKRAVGLLGSRKIDSIRCPAVIENTVAIELLQAFSSAFLADNVSKGRSFLAGKVRKKVVSNIINITDDGLMPGGWATSNFDGEGVKKTQTPLIGKGLLKGFLYDTYWAKRAGKKSTGNGVRGGFKGLPSIGTTNLHIETGKKDLNTMLKTMDSGFLITELLGAHTINPVNGEFSLGAQGFWIEKGEICYPVRGMAISGDLLDLFSGIAEVGSDIRYLGSTGAPSLLISDLDVSGGA